MRWVSDLSRSTASRKRSPRASCCFALARSQRRTAGRRENISLGISATGRAHRNETEESSVVARGGLRCARMHRGLSTARDRHIFAIAQTCALSFDRGTFGFRSRLGPPRGIQSCTMRAGPPEARRIGLAERWTSRLERSPLPRGPYRSPAIRLAAYSSIHRGPAGSSFGSK